jgi:hypothetical protein
MEVVLAPAFIPILTWEIAGRAINAANRITSNFFML